MPKVALIFLLLCSLLLLPACQREKENGGSGGRPPQRVEVATAEEATVPAYIDVLGRIVATETVAVTPEVTGQITQIHFEQGTVIEQGQLLYTIEKSRYEAAVKEWQGELAEAKAAVEIARIELERSRPLVPQELISDQELDVLETSVEQRQARVVAAEGRLAEAQIDLDKSTIESPIRGVAGTYLVTKGNVVQAMDREPLVRINQIAPAYVDFFLPESQFARLREAFETAGGELKVEITDLTNESRTGSATLKILGNEVSRTSGTVVLRADLPNEDRRFWPGQQVKVRVILREMPDVVLVPRPAVQTGQEGRFVFVVEEMTAGEFQQAQQEKFAEQGGSGGSEQENGDDPEGRKASGGPSPGSQGPFSVARQRPVEIGQQQPGDKVVITSGLKPGEEVITEGQVFLRDLSKVNVVRPGANPASGAPPGEEAKGSE